MREQKRLGFVYKRVKEMLNGKGVQKVVKNPKLPKKRSAVPVQVSVVPVQVALWLFLH